MTKINLSGNLQNRERNAKKFYNTEHPDIPGEAWCCARSCWHFTETMTATRVVPFFSANIPSLGHNLFHDS